jgi:hypothetical protein
LGDCFSLRSFLKIKKWPAFTATLLRLRLSFDKKIGWATFLAILYQTHPVTLLPIAKGEKTIFLDIVKGGVANGEINQEN